MRQRCSLSSVSAPRDLATRAQSSTLGTCRWLAPLADLPHRRHDKVGAGADAGRPTRGDGLELGIEADAFGSVPMVTPNDDDFQPPNERNAMSAGGDRRDGEPTLADGAFSSQIDPEQNKARAEFKIWTTAPQS